MPQPPSPATISDLLDSLQDSFAWQVRADEYELTDTWERSRSGSLFYRLVGTPVGPEVIVKIVGGWKPGTPERMFRAMIELDDLITSAVIDGAHGVRPLAWSDDPPLVVMPYVDGSDLVSIIRQPDDEAWRSGNLKRWMEKAGAILAAYHQIPAPGWQGDIEAAGTEVRDLASKLRVKPKVVEEILTLADWRTRSKRRYGDYGPGNLQGAPDGTVFLLDPPEESQTSIIHRDISNFLFETRRQLAGRGFTPSAAVKGRFLEFRERFLGGYAQASPGLVFGPPDDALLALFEVKRAAAMALKRFPRRPGDSVWFARLAMRRRRDLSRAVTAARLS